MSRFLRFLLCLQAASSALAVSFYQHRDVPLRRPVTVNQSFGIVKENGGDWGYLQIRNHCQDTLNVWSVGVHPLGGPRDPKDGFGTAGDEQKIPIRPGATWTEPLRVTCPCPFGWDVAKGNTTIYNATQYMKFNTTNINATDLYCIPEDKLAGQGVSVKIAKTDQPSGDIIQLEYALVKDPNRGPPPGDPFHRINYDVSLLDCGPRDNINDFTATVEQHDAKVADCPGYEDGLSLTFDNDTETTNCPPTYCDGKNKCLMAYLWDRTRKGESSLGCEREYFGDMTLDLCVGKAVPAIVAQAENQQNAWIATANNLPSGVSRTGGSAPTPSAGEGTVLPASSTSSLNGQLDTRTAPISDQVSASNLDGSLVVGSDLTPNTASSPGTESALPAPALSNVPSTSSAATHTSESIALRKDPEKRSASPRDIGPRSLDPSTLTTLYTSQVPETDFQASTALRMTNPIETNPKRLRKKQISVLR